MAKNSTVIIDLPDEIHTPGTATDSLSVLNGEGEASVPAVVPWHKVFEFASKLSDEEYTLFANLTHLDIDRKRYRADQWAYLLYLYAVQLTKTKDNKVASTVDRLKSAHEMIGDTQDGFKALFTTLSLDNLSEEHRAEIADESKKTFSKEAQVALESVHKALIHFVIRATSVEQIEPRYKGQVGVTIHNLRKKIGSAGKWLNWIASDSDEPELREVATKKPSLISARLRDATLNFPFLEEVFSWWSADFEEHYLTEQIAHLTNEQLMTFLYYMRTVYTDCRNKMQAASCQKVCVLIEEELTQRVTKTFADEKAPIHSNYSEAIRAEILIPWHATLNNGIAHAEETLRDIQPHGDVGVFRAAQRRFMAWLRGAPKEDSKHEGVAGGAGEKSGHSNAETLADALRVAADIASIAREGAAIARGRAAGGSLKEAAKEAVEAAAHRASGKKGHN